MSPQDKVDTINLDVYDAQCAILGILNDLTSDAVTVCSLNYNLTSKDVSIGIAIDIDKL